MIAEVVISQTYTNVENDTIEAIYKFPTHESAAICAFEAEIDGKKVKGIVKETQEAVKEYNTAIQTELKHDSETEKIRFVIPTSIAPRYGSYGPSEISSFASNLPLVNTVNPTSNLSISVTCRMTSVITSIESPSHYISTELNIDGDPKISRITLNEQTTYLEKDFVLVVKSQVTETNCAMLTLVPKFAINPTLTELIFVVDRSGSMVEAPIRKAAQALELFLRSLPEDSFFNVVSFGSHYDSLFPKSQPNSQSAISAALSLAQNMTANYNGTEMYQCLKWVLENKRNDMPTAVILLTDGSVWNVDQIAELVRSKVEESNDLRLFSLGIGRNVAHNLVEAVARAGKGYAQFVTDCNNDGFEKKIIGFLKNSIRPPIKDYKVEWTENGVIEVEDDEPSKNILERPIISFFNEGDESLPQLPPEDDFISRLQFLQAPYDIPPIYRGVRLIVYCILAKGVEPRKSITLSAMSQDGSMRLEIPIDPVTLQGTKIHTLAARKLIQNLEDGTSFLHKHQKYRGKQVPNSIVRNQIVALDVDMTKEQGHKPLQMVVPNYTPPNYQKVGFGSNQSNYSVFSQQNPQTIGFGQIPGHMSFNSSSINKSAFGAQPCLSQFGGFAVPTSTQPQACSGIRFGGFNKEVNTQNSPNLSRFGGFAVTQSSNNGGFGFGSATQTASQSLFGQNTSNS
ncbi:18057_t:CDS:2, partial [Racocetra fulgida]